MSGLARRWFSAGVLAGTVAVLGACSNDAAGPAGPEGSHVPSAPPGGVQRGRVASWDDEISTIAEQVPGFGGFFQEAGSNRMVVYVNDLSRGEQAKAAVAAFLAARHAVHGPLEVRRGEYDFRDIVLVAGSDPYAWKGTTELSKPHSRPEKDGGCDR